MTPLFNFIVIIIIIIFFYEWQNQISRIPQHSLGSHSSIYCGTLHPHDADDLIAGWCTLTHLWNEASSRTHRRTPLACQVKTADDTEVLGREESVFPPQQLTIFYWVLHFPAASIISLLSLFFFIIISSVLFSKNGENENKFHRMFSQVGIMILEKNT